jgi:hypothetical protein
MAKPTVNSINTNTEGSEDTHLHAVLPVSTSQAKGVCLACASQRGKLRYVHRAGLAYLDRDSGPANHHLCTTDLTGSRHAGRRRGAEGSNVRKERQVARRNSYRTEGRDIILYRF